MNGKKISVAMATYNGEKYIKAQLLSICNQIRKPDEIIISDDGSKDETVNVAIEVSKCPEAKGINFIILTNNPRHGIGGNFEWAIRHTSGECIFICGQDDIWLPEKVSKVVDVFEKHSDAKMVCHNLENIDNDLNCTESHLLDIVRERLQISDKKGELYKLDRDQFLELSVSKPFISGTAICISSELVPIGIPIPVDDTEDQWLAFCALYEDGCYYLDEVLTQYRIHESTTHSIGMKPHMRIKRIFNRAVHVTVPDKHLRFGNAALKLMKNSAGDTEIESAIWTATRIRDIGRKEMEAFTSSRLRGAVILTSLYKNDMRYRNNGRNHFIYGLLHILLFSKRRRVSLVKKKKCK